MSSVWNCANIPSILVDFVAIYLQFLHTKVLCIDILHCAWSFMFRFNGMNLRQFCVLKEFHHGSWSHLWQQLLRAPNLCRGTSGRDRQFYPHKHLISLHLVWKLLSSTSIMQSHFVFIFSGICLCAIRHVESPSWLSLSFLVLWITTWARSLSFPQILLRFSWLQWKRFRSPSSKQVNVFA